jgi:hypothetical protein
MPSYISPSHLTTNSPMAAQEITGIMFNRHGDEWLCDLYAAETRIAGGRGSCMEFALTSAINARNDALRDGKN